MYSGPRLYRGMGLMFSAILFLSSVIPAAGTSAEQQSTVVYSFLNAFAGEGNFYAVGDITKTPRTSKNNVYARSVLLADANELIRRWTGL